MVGYAPDSIASVSQNQDLGQRTSPATGLSNTMRRLAGVLRDLNPALDSAGHELHRTHMRCAERGTRRNSAVESRRGTSNGDDDDPTNRPPKNKKKPRPNYKKREAKRRKQAEDATIGERLSQSEHLHRSAGS